MRCDAMRTLSTSIPPSYQHIRVRYAQRFFSPQHFNMFLVFVMTFLATAAAATVLGRS